MPTERSLFLGIECVGLTMSVSLLTDETGKILVAARYPFGLALHTTPKDELLSGLVRILARVKSESCLPDSVIKNANLCLGLSGATFPYDWEILVPQLLSRVGFKNVLATGDAEIVFSANSDACAGGVILCHAGSTAYWFDRGRGFRYGGWGPVIGDEGSGYWIGQECLRSIALMHDRGGDGGLLWEKVREWLSSESHYLIDGGAVEWRWLLKTVNEGRYDEKTAVFAFFHQIEREMGLSAARKVISSLVVPVFEAWRKNDECATRIVKQAARLLVRAFVSLYKQRVPASEFPIVIYGGCINYNADFRELVTHKLKEYFQSERASFISLQTSNSMRPVCGAVLRSYEHYCQDANAQKRFRARLSDEQKRVPALAND